MTETPLYVLIPEELAEALNKAVASQGRKKKFVVAVALAQYLSIEYPTTESPSNGKTAPKTRKVSA